MSEPIDIPGAEQPQQIYVSVKAPNGTIHQVMLYDSNAHPATLQKLADEIEANYGTVFPTWDPIAYPVQLYTEDWVQLNDLTQLVNTNLIYGACPQGADPAQFDAGGQEGVFQMDM